MGDGPKLSIFSITNQLSVGIIGLAVFSVALTGSILIYRAFDTQEQQLYALQQERSRAVAREINNYLGDLQQKISYLSRLGGLTDMAPDVRTGLLEALSRQYDAFQSLSLLDENARIVTDFAPVGDYLSDVAAGSPEFVLPMQQGEYYISPVAFGNEADLPMLTMSVPVRNRQDRINGVLVARIDLRFLEFAASAVSVGERGYTYVLDERNRLITNQRRQISSINLDSLLDASIFERARFGLSLHPVASYRGLSGDNVIGAISAVVPTGWSVVAELPTNEAYAPIRNMVVLMSAMGAGAVAVAAVLAWLLSRKLVGPLRRLTEAAAALAAGDRGVEVIVSGRNELGILARTFNNMSSQIRNLLTDLEDRIRERQQAQEELQETHRDLETRNESLAIQVTQRVRAEEVERRRSRELESALQQLEATQQQLVQSAKLAAGGELIAGVAHELNNPLTGIWGLTQLLIEGDLDDSLREELEMINWEAGRSVLLVQNLLSFARPSADRRAYTSVNPAIKAVLALRDYKLKLDDIRLEVHLQPDLPRTMLDASSIQQVILNLVVNAEQAMLKAHRGGRLLVSSEQVDDMIWIVVSDNGPGILKEHLSRVFDPFFTTKEVGVGTGLGLSICYGIVRDHGGRIRVSSEPTNGATFTVELPIVSAIAEPPSGREYASDESGRVVSASPRRG